MYAHNDIQSINESPVLSCSESWQIREIQHVLVHFHREQLHRHVNLRPKYIYTFLLVQPIFNTAGDVSAAQHSLETVLLEILLVCLLCVYRKDGRLAPPHSLIWVLVTQSPPQFVPVLLRAQDQCPPRWQMALMKLDNSAYMHKRMLNIDSEDQRSGAYSTL